MVLHSQQLLKHKYHLKIVHCLLNISNYDDEDDVEDLDLVKLKYNLIEHSSNYSETTEILWFYSKDEAISFKPGNFKSFTYNAKLLGNTAAQPLPNAGNGLLKNAAVLLKYLSNFLRSFEMPLINCKVELNLDGQSIVC